MRTFPHEHDVLAAERRPAIQKVQLLEGHHLSDLRSQLPVQAALLEVLDQHPRGEAAIDLELTERAAARSAEHGAVDVRRDNPHVPARELGKVLSDEHRDAERLLARRRGGAPDPQGAGRGPRRDELREHSVLECLERMYVAEERGLVGREGRGPMPRSIERRPKDATAW
jgi:hypothetical protein